MVGDQVSKVFIAFIFRVSYRGYHDPSERSAATRPEDLNLQILRCENLQSRKKKRQFESPFWTVFSAFVKTS